MSTSSAKAYSFRYVENHGSCAGALPAPQYNKIKEIEDAVIGVLKQNPNRNLFVFEHSLPLSPYWDRFVRLVQQQGFEAGGACNKHSVPKPVLTMGDYNDPALWHGDQCKFYVWRKVEPLQVPQDNGCVIS